MFKFNFIPPLNTQEDQPVVTEQIPPHNSTHNLKFLNLDSLNFPSNLSTISDEGNVLFSIEPMVDPSEDDGSELNYLKRIQTCSKSADRLLQQEQKGVMLTNPQQDVIPGFYEGGLKVWECSLDLCRYLREEILSNNLESSLLQCRSFLELGCGHGLPTCLLVRTFGMNSQVWNNGGPSTSSSSYRTKPIFVLSDYNEFVLKEVTWPNLVLNSSPSMTCNRTQSFKAERDLLSEWVVLVSGDWIHLSNNLAHPNEVQPPNNPLPPTGRFDCILAAETLYTLSSTRDTANFIMNHLELETGIALIATKRYYFGMGLCGGTDEFMSVLGTQSFVKDKLVYRPRIERIREFEEGTVRDLLGVRLVCT